MGTSSHISTSTRTEIFDAIDQERNYQDKKWGGTARDSLNKPYNWLVFIQTFLGKAAERAMMLTEPENTSKVGPEVRVEYRRQLVKVAALCVAAIETLDASSE